MADNARDDNEANTRGTDWEVVSLTASTYAAAPGPQGSDPTVQHKNEEFSRSEHESPESMFMSKHFAVAQHENYSSEIYNESDQDEKITEPPKSDQDECKIDANNDEHGSQLFGMGCSLSDQGMNLGDVKQEEDLKMVKKELAFDDEANASIPVIHDDILDLVEPRNPSQEELDCPWRAPGCKPNEENESDSFDDSSESWWKKRAMSVYNHAKETNTFWSIFVAVAVAGLVILGQQWRREKFQFQQFKWKFIGPGEKINRIEFKYLLSGNHRGMPMREGIHPTF